MKMMSVLLGTVLLGLLLTMCPTGASDTIYVDDDNEFDPFMDGSEAHPYDTIQKAVYDAVDGDTIIVRPGTYTPDAGHTEVLVNVRVLLDGAGPTRTTIDGDGLGNALHLSADGVEVSGFTVTGANDLASGVRISGDGCLLEDCIVTGNAVGIALDGNGGEVRNCTVRLNTATGIRIRLLSGNNTITSCLVQNNTQIGIQASNGNRIEDTVVAGSNRTIVLMGGANDVVGCDVYNATRGVHVLGSDNVIDGCRFRNCSAGVSIDEDDLTESIHNSVIDCVFSGGETGILLDDDENVVEGCTLGGWWTGVNILGDGNSVRNCTTPEGMWGTGIEAHDNSMTTVSGCEFHNNGFANVWAMFADDLTFEDCLFNGSYMGLNIYQCNRTTVTGCDIVGTWQGVSASSSADLEVTDCAFDVREAGLQLDSMTGAVVDHCEFTGGGIVLYGWEAEHFDSH
ncbi:MAG: right-handed parallel beta-helix repeat-containing protein, partial [Thermoplasmata archaeon]|nr:right-handed parallel beta-helix repeat-containing protein [Thermoplasmata archaeon]